MKLAVLGGGLTGLSTAYYISRAAPQARITVYEGSQRLGGWLHTAKSDAMDSAAKPHTVLFERGPRVVQLKKDEANSHLYAELIHDLGIENEAWTLGANSELARRYIYHPDHLVNLSGPMTGDSAVANAASRLRFASRMLASALREPALAGVIPGLMHAWRSRRPVTPEEYCQVLVGLPDESIGTCITRLLGGRREVADNLASAMAHGIYGGNIWNLSVQSTMFARAQMLPYYMAQPSSGERLKLQVQRLSDLEVLRSIYRSERASATRAVADKFLGGFTGFRGGFDTLAEALVRELRRNPNVTIKTGTPVTKLGQPQQDLVEVEAGGSTETYDKVISTLFSKQLSSISRGLLPALEDSEAVTIHCVNIWFPRSGLNLPHRGFGYLISSQAEVEPGLLGVLFDSDREEAFHRASGEPAPPGTKLTVLVRAPAPHEPARTPEQARHLALAHVRRQFAIPDSEPVHSQVAVARDCIPQHRVGHQSRMAAAHAQLAAAFAGRVAVAGASYTAPGVLPAIRAARDVAASLFAPSHDEHHHPATAAAGLPVPPSVGLTGLARFADARRSMWHDLVLLDPRHDAEKWAFVYQGARFPPATVPRLQFSPAAAP